MREGSARVCADANCVSESKIRLIDRDSRSTVEAYAGDRGSRRSEVSLPSTAIHAARPAYETGVGGGGRVIRAAGARQADFADKAREVFPDPGASKMRSEYERSFTEQRHWCGLIRSGCKPVHRRCLRSSSKALSRTREPLANDATPRVLGGYPQRHSGHHQGLPRRRPGGRPPPR